MAGLLDFIQTPAGVGIMSAIAGGLANARRGTPFNNVGRAGMAGLLGYSQAQDQVNQNDKNAYEKQFNQAKINEIQSKITNDAALKNASMQSMRQAMTPGSYGPLGYRPTDPSAFDGQLAQGNAPEDQAFNQANVKAIAEGNNALAPPPPSQFDFGKYKAAMGQNLAQAGFADEALKFKPPEDKVPEPYSLSPGQIRFGADNKQLAAVPATPKEGSSPYGQDMREWMAVNGIDPSNATHEQLLAAYSATNQQKDRRVPKTSVVNNINQSTEKKFGEKFAEAAAGQDIASYEAAQKAPELASRSNRIKQVLSTGKVITGFGAEPRLAFGKALGLVGANDAETIANTESLAADLSKNTLDAIKASGLGSGNGFSNADRDFLEKAAGGKITLEAATLSRLADLSHRAATLSADKWNKRSKMIPKSAMEGTGITSDPIAVPPLYGNQSPARPKPGMVKDGYQFIGGDPANPKMWAKVKQ